MGKRQLCCFYQIEIHHLHSESTVADGVCSHSTLISSGACCSTVFDFAQCFVSMLDWRINLFHAKAFFLPFPVSLKVSWPFHVPVPFWEFGFHQKLMANVRNVVEIVGIYIMAFDFTRAPSLNISPCTITTGFCNRFSLNSDFSPVSCHFFCSQSLLRNGLSGSSHFQNI